MPVAKCLCRVAVGSRFDQLLHLVIYPACATLRVVFAARLLFSRDPSVIGRISQMPGEAFAQYHRNIARAGGIRGRGARHSPEDSFGITDRIGAQRSHDLYITGFLESNEFVRR